MTSAWEQRDVSAGFTQEMTSEMNLKGEGSGVLLALKMPESLHRPLMCLESSGNDYHTCVGHVGRQ